MHVSHCTYNVMMNKTEINASEFDVGLIESMKRAIFPNDETGLR